MSACRACRQSLAQQVLPQVCVGFQLFPHVVNTPDRWEREGSGPTGDQFLQCVRKACSLLQAGENNTSQPANFIRCHFLSFSLPLLLKHNSVPPWLPTVHHCEAEVGCSVLSKVSKLSPQPRMFSLSLYFSCHVPKAKINQTSWF